MNVVDTSGWIEFFFKGPNAAEFAPIVSNTDNLLVPVVCLYEVFKKLNLHVDEARALQAVAQMKLGRVAELSEEIALSAALISIKHRLPMADSFIYASAQVADAILWTQDQHFDGLPGVRFIAPG